MSADTSEIVAATVNQFACPSYNFYVQLLRYPMYDPGGMNARVCHAQWSKPYSILAPTQDSNPGGRIQNHQRWPLHYHCTLCLEVKYQRKRLCFSHKSYAHIRHSYNEYCKFNHGSRAWNSMDISNQREFGLHATCSSTKQPHEETDIRRVLHLWLNIWVWS